MTQFSGDCSWRQAKQVLTEQEQACCVLYAARARGVSDTSSSGRREPLALAHTMLQGNSDRCRQLGLSSRTCLTLKLTPTRRENNIQARSRISKL